MGPAGAPPITAQGTVALASGAATVLTTFVTASSIIMLTIEHAGVKPGAIWVVSRVPGVSFTIGGSQSADNSLVGWTIREPA
jgi:hypothetical protein